VHDENSLIIRNMQLTADKTYNKADSAEERAAWIDSIEFVRKKLSDQLTRQTERFAQQTAEKLALILTQMANLRWPSVSHSPYKTLGPTHFCFGQNF